MLKPVLEQIAQNNQGKVLLYRVNVQKLPELAQRFGIRGIPYVIFVKDKALVTALMGVQSAEAYQEIIDRSSKSAVQSR
jgi:thioredoxin 1